jgi:hypothetical protein
MFDDIELIGLQLCLRILCWIWLCGIAIGAVLSLEPAYYLCHARELECWVYWSSIMEPSTIRIFDRRLPFTNLDKEVILFGDLLLLE